MSHRRIYVASSWRNLYQQTVVRSLRNAGHDVYNFMNPRPGNNGYELVPNDLAQSSTNMVVT